MKRHIYTLAVLLISAALVAFPQGTTLPPIPYAQPGSGIPLSDSPQSVALLSQILSALNRPLPVYVRGPLGNLGANSETPLYIFQPNLDPCSRINKANLAVSVTANTKLLSGIGSPYKFCGIFLFSTSAESFSIVEGTGTTCATSTLAIVGSTTAANGPGFGATQGYTEGNGLGTVAQQKIPGNDVCILISGSTLVAGNIMYAF